MKTLFSLVFALVFVTLACPALAQTNSGTDDSGSAAAASPGAPEVQKLPSNIKFWLYPGNLAVRGHSVDVVVLAQENGSVKARVTMNGKGQNQCTVNQSPAVGTFDGQQFKLTVEIKQGDNVTCPMSFDLKIGPGGAVQEGRFSNPPYGGTVKNG